MTNRRPQQSNTNGELNFVDSLWKTANKLRGSVESAEYKHIVLGLIFLKYISDAFVERQSYLERAVSDPGNPEYYSDSAVIEEKDEYTGENIFWVPKEARCSYLMANATNPNLGKLIDGAITAIEKESPKQFRAVLPKIYARSNLDHQTLGEIINLFSTIGFGTEEAISKDILGRVYEYFIGRFAQQEGKGGGEFYTPRCIVKLLVEMLEPYHAYRGEEGLSEYEDIAGFCKVATIDEIRENGYVLTPGRYVGTEEIEGDGEPFGEKMERLTAELDEQFKKSEELKELIKKNLGVLGYGF